jgi:hypothetical protein
MGDSGMGSTNSCIKRNLNKRDAIGKNINSTLSFKLIEYVNHREIQEAVYI